LLSRTLQRQTISAWLQNAPSACSEVPMLPIRISLPGGKLKIKGFRHLRSDELARQVPVLKLGQLYVIWRRSVKSRND